MNNDKSEKSKIYSLLSEAVSIAVIPSPNRKADSFYAGVGLYRMLKGMQKNVNFVYMAELTDPFTDVISKDEILSDISQKSLIVSIDYSNTDASKVNYYTQKDTLFVKIFPVTKDFNTNEKVNVKLVGFGFDIIFVIGAENLLNLGDISKNLESTVDTSKIINIDNSSRNERYGFINIVDNSSSSLSLLILQKSPFWGIKINDDSAKALLKGISSAKLQ